MAATTKEVEYISKSNIRQTSTTITCQGIALYRDERTALDSSIGVGIALAIDDRRHLAHESSEEFMKMVLPAEVWLSLAPVDMRLGIDGLSRQIQAVLGKSPCDGSAYAFCNKRGNRIKLLIWDGTGVWLSQRRLHTGRFNWPREDDQDLYTVDTDQWQWLTCGVDWQRLSAKPKAHWQV